jgi:hypothetical protein
MDASRASYPSRTAWIIWLNFIAGIFVYVVVILLVRKTAGAPPPAPAASFLPTLRWVFYGVGVIDLAVSFALRRWMGSTRGGTGGGPGPRTTDATVATPGPLPTTLGSSEASALPLSGLIVGWALCESIAILGLVLAFLGGGLGDAIPLFALALAGLALQRPS